MASEEWKIILQSEVGGAGEGAGGGGAGGAAGQQGETPNQRKNLFEDAGKVFSAIASTAGMLAILIRSIGGSTVASTFMEVIFKILGALWDLFLINFLPIFMVLVRWLLSLMPIVKELGESLKPLIELIADKLAGLLDAVTEWIVPRLLEFAKALTAFGTTGDISPLLAWGEKFFKDLFELASKLFMDMITWVKEKGPEIIESIGKSVTIFADWLKTNGPTIVNTIVSGIKIMQETLDPLFAQLVAVLGPIFEQVFEPIKAKAIEIWNWLKEHIFTPLYNWLKDELLGRWLRDILKSLTDYIGQLFKIEIGVIGTRFQYFFDHFFDVRKLSESGRGEMGAEQATLIKAYRDQHEASLKQIEGLRMIQLNTENFPSWVSSSTKQTEILVQIDESLRGLFGSSKEQLVAAQKTAENTGKVYGTGNAVASLAPLSNSAQTGKVELSQWAKTIYENMTGKQYI
jgi:hypothetical protein